MAVQAAVGATALCLHTTIFFPPSIQPCSLKQQSEGTARSRSSDSNVFLFIPVLFWAFVEYVPFACFHQDSKFIVHQYTRLQAFFFGWGCLKLVFNSEHKISIPQNNVTQNT